MPVKTTQNTVQTEIPDNRFFSESFEDLPPAVQAAIKTLHVNSPRVIIVRDDRGLDEADAGMIAALSTYIARQRLFIMLNHIRPVHFEQVRRIYGN